ncbi:hypothetical protein BURMUCF2_1456 [Burkholderia multivorans CF2]|nr:hypothetical protein BURMUCF2_1456 [Burkholderia multivorans CF2]
MIGAARRACAPVATGRDTGSAPPLRRGFFLGALARSHARTQAHRGARDNDIRIDSLPPSRDFLTLTP